MSNAALFSSTSKASDASFLYQFQAGKLTQEGKTVTADPRKGCAYLYVSKHNALHFCWFDRSTGMVEDNFVINPQNSSFKKVNQCKEGRVYRLKSGDKRFFLWMQEAEKDDANIYENMKTHLTNNSKNSNELIPGLNKLSEKDLLNLLSMGVYGDLNTPMKGYGSKGASSSGTKPKSKIQMEDLRNIMASIGGGQSQPNKSVDLGNVINVDNLKPILEKAGTKNSLKNYLPNLPSSSEDPILDSVRDEFSDPVSHIRSPQFKASLNAFNNALHRRALGDLVSQFKLGSKVNEAASKGDILEFAKALEEHMEQNKDDKEDQMDTS